MAAKTPTDLFHQRESLKHGFDAKKHEIKARKGSTKELVYPNQAEAAVTIIDEFFNKDKVLVTLVASPQVGKTGTFLQVAYLACTHPDDDSIIDPRDIFIITGMSDRDWQKQTQDDMLEAFKRRVYHRGRLNTKDREDGFNTNLSIAKNALIIIDECHIGAEKEHMVSDCLRTLGLLDINILRKRNIKILEVSATPGATLYDSIEWGPKNHAVVLLKPSSKYVGFKNFIQEKRIHNSLDLTKIEGIDALTIFIKERFTQPRYHIIRMPAKSRSNAEFEKNMKKICDREGWIMNNHSALDRVHDIDYHLTTEPKQHSFLIIKEFWRAGKRFDDSFMGIVHEPLTKAKDTNVTAQGLAGRLCGNDKKSGASAAQIFCDVERISEYNDWFDLNGDWDAIIQKKKSYYSRCLTIVNGVVSKHKDTLAHPSNVKGLDDDEDDKPKKPPKEPKTVPVVLTLTDAEYKKIHKIGAQWDFTSILMNIAAYNPELAGKLETIHDAGGQDLITEPNSDSTRRIIQLCVEHARNGSVHYVPGNLHDTNIDKYTIILDNNGPKRIIVCVFNGASHDESVTEIVSSS
jgi:hypothetical protein